MIWKGDKVSLQTFRLNQNNKKIVLTWKYDQLSMIFLNVEMSIQGGKICTRNYCKPTDRNEYIAIDSYHHRPWLLNIPRGQFVRLRRNCTKEEASMEQATHFGSKFLQKGYEDKFIKKGIGSS